MFEETLFNVSEDICVDSSLANKLNNETKILSTISKIRFEKNKVTANIIKYSTNIFSFKKYANLFLVRKIMNIDIFVLF